MNYNQIISTLRDYKHTPEESRDPSVIMNLFAINDRIIVMQCLVDYNMLAGLYHDFLIWKLERIVPENTRCKLRMPTKACAYITITETNQPVFSFRVSKDRISIMGTAQYRNALDRKRINESVQSL